jgi:hypothetical protein
MWSSANVRPMDEIQAAQITLERLIRSRFKGKEAEAWLRWLSKKVEDARRAQTLQAETIPRDQTH